MLAALKALLGLETQTVQAASVWRPKVIVPNAVHDGLGGYYPVGARIDASPETIASLVAKGLVE